MNCPPPKWKVPPLSRRVIMLGNMPSQYTEIRAKFLRSFLWRCLRVGFWVLFFHFIILAHGLSAWHTQHVCAQVGCLSCNLKVFAVDVIEGKFFKHLMDIHYATICTPNPSFKVKGEPAPKLVHSPSCVRLLNVG